MAPGAIEQDIQAGTARQKHTRRCLSVAEMVAKGMRQADNGAWTTGLTFGGLAA
jgi:DNA-binding CsgD family transcriptional regulator